MKGLVLIPLFLVSALAAEKGLLGYPIAKDAEQKKRDHALKLRRLTAAESAATIPGPRRLNSWYPLINLINGTCCTVQMMTDSFFIWSLSIETVSHLI